MNMEETIISRKEIEKLKPYERLDLIMDKFSISSAELGRVAGVSASQVLRMRKGAYEGYASTWKKIADALVIPMDWFFN